MALGCCGLLMASLLQGCTSTSGGPQAVKTRVALIFADVTNSLKPEESQQVAQLTAQVVNSLPRRSEFVVYPIQIETQRLSPILRGTVPAAISDKEKQAYELAKAQRDQDLAKKIDALYNEVRKNKEDNRTCILNTLGFAKNFFQQYADPGKYDLDLVYISDMTEECRNTPVHSLIKLNKREINSEIRIIQSLPDGNDLSNVRVTVIIPTAEATYSANQKLRPDMEDLKRFWLAAFNRCGFNQRSFLDNEERLYWSIGLPKRFQSQSN
ncbi:MAG: hypothetical protein ACJ74G_23000 [Blastocatellia bacterium]